METAHATQNGSRRRSTRRLATWTALVGVTIALVAAPAAGKDDLAPLLTGLGRHHHAITTTVAEAQTYFDQGLRLYYAFNFEEAARAFASAARLDPACAMCYWGTALVLGPNINAPMDPRRGRDAYHAIQTALTHSAMASAKEQAYIRAMAARYAADPFAPREPLEQAYADTTGEVASRYPDDPDAAVLHAAALMQLSPWDYWTSDRRPRTHTQTILSRLRGAMKRDADHAGACHFFIHAVEAAFPEWAVPCAETLPSLMPSAGHVVHMPAHVYIRVGRYDDAIDRNVHAVHTDEAYIAENHPAGEYPLAYYPHNYHFLSFAAIMAGRKADAFEAARHVVAHTDQTMLREPDLGALQHFVATPLRTMVRFGAWDEILAVPSPDDDLTYPRGMWHFARGMAFAATSKLNQANGELSQLRDLVSAETTAAVVIFGLNNGTQVLEIAEDVLAGRLAAARGDTGAAVTLLREAMAHEEALTYNEPPDWDLPVRHVLGQVLNDAGRFAEAEEVYRADLDKFPRNGWALTGLVQSLRAQGRHAEAAQLAVQLKEAWKTADVAPVGSIF